MYFCTKQDGHVYIMSSDHGNSDGGGTGDIGSDEYLHYYYITRQACLRTLRVHNKTGMFTHAPNQPQMWALRLSIEY
ncbi:protein of unknown function [Alteromonas macleodii]|uniref:Uncharacterized protein n=1 Tax=Alteromonas macleodii TaxID=28108 RepID=A0A6T9Y1P5_ALTMA|nr:protein of unknown function [Alteromonas macleodii]